VYRRSFPDVRWAESGFGQMPAWVVPMGDLPGFYRCVDADFPAHTGYLLADPEDSKLLRTRLLRRARGRPIVGLAPSGGCRWTHGAFRSVAPSEWSPLFSVPALFVGLGYREEDDRLSETAAAVGAELLTCPEIVRQIDYSRTFDLVAALDLVITVPTSVLHVAGALGVPCWVAMDQRAAWRECSRDAAIPWYPVSHARFLRGRVDDGWCDLIRRMARRLLVFQPGQLPGRCEP